MYISIYTYVRFSLGFLFGVFCFLRVFYFFQLLQSVDVFQLEAVVKVVKMGNMLLHNGPFQSLSLSIVINHLPSPWNDPPISVKEPSLF